MPTNDFFKWLRKKGRKYDPASSSWSWTQWFDEMVRQFDAEKGGRN